MSRPLAVVSLAAASLTVACVGPGLLTDGSAVSVGTHSNGALRQGRPLSFRGEGYVVPKRWQERRRNFGTDDLVELIIRTGRRMKQSHPNASLGVADLSLRGGGATREHRSHHSGRDVDFIPYSADLEGRPLMPFEMVYYDAEGMSIPAPRASPASEDVTSSPLQPPLSMVSSGSTAADPPLGAEDPQGHLSTAQPVRKLDVKRNWDLVKVLVTDPRVAVQWIFIGQPMARLLLQHARRTNEPPHVIERASAVMHQPTDSQSHMDHLHVRIYCPIPDRRQGCQDRGPARWLKKDLKYLDLPLPGVLTLPDEALQIGLLRPVRLANL